MLSPLPLSSLPLNGFPVIHWTFLYRSWTPTLLWTVAHLAVFWDHPIFRFYAFSTNWSRVFQSRHLRCPCLEIESLLNPRTLRGCYKLSCILRGWPTLPVELTFSQRQRKSLDKGWHRFLRSGIDHFRFFENDANRPGVTQIVLRRRNEVHVIALLPYPWCSLRGSINWTSASYVVILMLTTWSNKKQPHSHHGRAAFLAWRWQIVHDLGLLMKLPSLAHDAFRRKRNRNTT